MTDGFSTSFTRLLGIRHPIAVAPMAGMTTGALAGAVARSGGLGLLGVGSALLFDGDWVREECATAIAEAGPEATGAIGFGFIGCLMKPDDSAFLACLELSPSAVCLAYGDDYSPQISAAHEAGAQVICQVHTVAQASAVVAGGADIVSMQGCDAGGHGQQQLATSIVSLIPQARDVLGYDIPLLAAGGVMDGRGLAAALALGASGVSWAPASSPRRKRRFPGHFSKGLSIRRPETRAPLSLPYSTSWDRSRGRARTGRRGRSATAKPCADTIVPSVLCSMNRAPMKKHGTKPAIFPSAPYGHLLHADWSKR